VKRILSWVVAGLMTASVALYAGDWAVWRVRVARGGGMSVVTVTNIIVIPLKNNKEEYDWGGTASVSCSQSLFPLAGSGACWWVARHPVIYQR
jgi:hypothetical protein